MISYTRVNANDAKEIIFCLQNINKDKAYENNVIPEYLTKHLNCEEIPQPYNLQIKFKRDGITFLYIPDDFIGSYFSSENHQMESNEYYDKLEKVVQELVEVLNKYFDNEAEME